MVRSAKNRYFLAFAFACFFLLVGPQISCAAKTEFLEIKQTDRNRILLADGKWVRLIGVDTTGLSSSKKSSILFSDEMKRFMQKFEGKTAYIELDENNAGISHRDGGDMLAYVYYLESAEEAEAKGGFGVSGKPVMIMDSVRSGEKGQVQVKATPHVSRFLNSEVLQQGYGRLDTSKPMKHAQTLSASYQDAKAKKLGIWE